MRVDSHIYAGYTIPSNYDSMIAKLITVAQTREEAINTMERALSEFVVEGVKTTIPFHRQVMTDAGFIAGEFDTGYIDSRRLDEVPKRPGAAQVAAVAAALLAQYSGGSMLGRPVVGGAAGSATILASGTTDRSLPSGHTDGGGLDPWLSRVYVDMRRSGDGW